MAFDNKQFVFTKEKLTVLDTITNENFEFLYDELDFYRNKNAFPNNNSAIKAFELRVRILIRQSFLGIDEDELERLTAAVVNFISSKLI